MICKCALYRDAVVISVHSFIHYIGIQINLFTCGLCPAAEPAIAGSYRAYRGLKGCIEWVSITEKETICKWI